MAIRYGPPRKKRGTKPKTANQYKVTAADRKANPSKSSLQIVQSRTGARNPNQKPSKLVKSGSPNRDYLTHKTVSPSSLPPSEAQTLGGSAASVRPNAGTDLINQRQFEGTQQFGQTLEDGQQVESELGTPSRFEPNAMADQNLALSLEEQSAQRQIYKPSGWKNVKDVLLLAVNPFSQTSIQANTGNSIGDFGLELVSNNPHLAAFGVSIGVMAATPTIITPITTQVATLNTLGTTGTLGTTAGTVGLIGTGGAATTAATAATNTFTQKATASLLTKILNGIPKFGKYTFQHRKKLVGGLMTLLGSYPFSGFIAEEAIQQTDHGFTSAMKIGNNIEAENALFLMDQISDPNLEESIVNGIPVLNIVHNLNRYFQGTRFKTRVNRMVMEDVNFQIKYGETDGQMYARIALEKKERDEAEKKAAESYYANIEEQRKKAKAEERAEDERYYAKIEQEREANEKEKQKEKEKYYREYDRKMDEIKRANPYIPPVSSTPTGHEESRQSNLGFGI